MPKTATKTLQWRVFSQHQDIFYLGRFDGGPFAGKYRAFEACRDESVFAVMDQIAYSGISNPDVGKCRRRLGQYLHEQNPENRLVVWSWESYSTDSAQSRRYRAENLKNLFGQAKIVATIRHPVKLLQSAYLQQLKRDNIGAGYRRGNGVFYCPIDDWFEQDHSGDISNHLDYAGTIGVYAELFGLENVKVLAFEDLLQDRRSWFLELCNFMGIDGAKALSSASDHKDNSRWNTTQLELLRKIKASPIRRLFFRYAKKDMRKKMLELNGRGAPKNDGDKASELLSASNHNSVIDRTREGNQWLEETFGLDLASWGYIDQ
jgi:hypothetical protein